MIILFIVSLAAIIGLSTFYRKQKNKVSPEINLSKDEMYNKLLSPSDGNEIETNSNDIINLCKSLSRKCFYPPKNFINGDCDFESNENEECFYFTAFMICCSSVYSQTHLKDSIEYNPHSNRLEEKYRFYQELVDAIHKEAERIGFINMEYDLNNFYDGETFFPELHPNYLIMEFFFRANNDIINYYAGESNDLNNLMYNLYFECGRLEYQYFKQDSTFTSEQIEEFQNSVKEANLMVMNFFVSHKIPYHKI